jgi:hypothetical protein
VAVCLQVPMGGDSTVGEGSDHRWQPGFHALDKGSMAGDLIPSSSFIPRCSVSRQISAKQQKPSTGHGKTTPGEMITMCSAQADVLQPSVQSCCQSHGHRGGSGLPSSLGWPHWASILSHKVLLTAF